MVETIYTNPRCKTISNITDFELVYHIPTGNNQSLRAAGKMTSNPGERLDVSVEVAQDLIPDVDETSRFNITRYLEL